MPLASVPARHAEHGIGALIVALEPSEHLVRSIGGNEHFQSPLRDPLAHERS